MTRHVIIMAQGRRPQMIRHAPMIPLPGCHGAPIIARTLVMARLLDASARITVVSELDMYAPIFSWDPMGESSGLHHLHAMIGDAQLETTELPDPGDTVLRGISRYLDHRSDLANLSALDFEPTQTVILMGDCVYSWRCMNVLFSDALPYSFVGSADIPKNGNLWGVTWRHRDANEPLVGWLKKALRKHQRSSLAQWVQVAIADLSPQPLLYTNIDDYTFDVDSEDDTRELERVSDAAAMDDLHHGIAWGPLEN